MKLFNTEIELKKVSPSISEISFPRKNYFHFQQQKQYLTINIFSKQRVPATFIFKQFDSKLINDADNTWAAVTTDITWQEIASFQFPVLQKSTDYAFSVIFCIPAMITVSPLTYPSGQAFLSIKDIISIKIFSFLAAYGHCLFLL